jgi:hypothetical protein
MPVISINIQPEPPRYSGLQSGEEVKVNLTRGFVKKTDHAWYAYFG